jgi:hypothetical protein
MYGEIILRAKNGSVQLCLTQIAGVTFENEFSPD